MDREILILQASPRIEIVFYEHIFKVRKSGAVLIDETEYAQLKSVRFIKGRIPWITGILTAVLDLIIGHGVGHWKRGGGQLELVTNTQTYSIALVNYDRGQTPIALKMLKERLK